MSTIQQENFEISLDICLRKQMMFRRLMIDEGLDTKDTVLLNNYVISFMNEFFIIFGLISSTKTL